MSLNISNREILDLVVGERQTLDRSNIEVKSTKHFLDRRCENWIAQDSAFSRPVYNNDKNLL